MTGFLDEVLIDGAKIDADFSGRIKSAQSIRTMDGASTVELTVIDADHKIRQTGILTRRGKPSKDSDFDRAAWNRFGDLRMTLGGRFYRLAGVSKGAGEDVLLLTFEDEVASLMRRFKGPEKASRNDMSRLDFVRHLAKRSRRYPIIVKAPEADVKQPIKGDTAHERSKEREKGLAQWKRLTVKGVRIDRQQRKNLETILAVADEDEAGERATIAMLCAAIGESAVRAVMNSAGSKYGGVFQGNVSGGVFKVTDTEEMAHYFLIGGKGFQQGGAIKLATDHPDMTSGDIATRVEASGEDPAFYGQWEDEATAILEAWGGVGRVKIERRRYEYEVYGKRDGEPAETYWDASGRLLVDEVRFRRFATDNVLWLVSDEWLFGRKPAFLIEESPDVLVGYDAHVGMPLGEVRVTARKPQWTGRPGQVVDVSEDEGPIAGHWLLQSIDEDLFGIEPANLLLRRPAPSLPEPEANKDKILLTEGPAEAGTVRRAIVDAAKRALSQKELYRYGQVRPMPSSLFEGGTHIRGPGGGHDEPIVTDCSGFATLVYKAAGAPDPNGRGYDGQGYTGTLAANGRKTNDPQPGDLVFYGSGAPWRHVAVYIGGGEVISFGSDPIKRLPMRYQPVGEIRTYEVG